MDVILLLSLVLLVFGVSIRAAVTRDEDAERAEIDDQEGVRVGADWNPDSADADATS